MIENTILYSTRQHF